MRATMVAPAASEVCGVADYVRYLLDELRARVEVPYVVAAGDFRPEMNAVDVVHVQHQYFLFGGVAPWRSRFGRLARCLTAPAVMTVHEFVEPAGNALFRAAVRVTNRLHFAHPKVHRLLVHTEADRTRMAAAGLAPERIVVVRHGVPPRPSLPPRDQARGALGVTDRFVVTLFGFLSRKKGHRLLLEALAGMPPQTVLLFAGGRHPDDRSAYVEGLEAAATGAGADRVRLTGYLQAEGVANVMSATDLVAAPFTQSSGSGSLAMAFACGKPVLASDIAPHREIVSETAGAAALFTSGNARALAAEVGRLAEDPQALEGLAEGAARYAAAHTYGRMADETVAVYRTVAPEVSGCASA